MPTLIQTSFVLTDWQSGKHVCIRTNVSTFLHEYVHVSMHAYIIYIHTCMHTYIHYNGRYAMPKKKKKKTRQT